ncbi:Abortive infection bacteriophage resistance protein [Mycoplasmopsis maculosa]|uniref:Abortive infection bacteriophage resistance protein n=1 Tax=Mycoplasmopsis maculosa TaxID=114885 RepID=A0A449B442_9BACT|nr:Abi family protein [Mycoplasmopsis maculosa]VEU75308.1 Abortive infection bacteriophage resistance protein [Mycoplasmopsis maculosa]
MTTFGQLIKLLDYLNKDIKNLVLNHFAKINQKLNVNYYQLISLMNIFKKIRNIICHNSIILNYELIAPNRKSKYYENISNFIFNNKLDIKIKKTIKLTDIIVIISFINEYNSTKKTLLEIFVDTLNTFINNETFDYKLVKKIKKNIKF